MAIAKSKVHVWWSAGGGKGKTTLAIMQAVALARHLARQSPNKVALLDFKEVSPHIHLYMGLEKTDLRPIFDAVERERLSLEMVQSCMQVKHGVSVLTGVGLNDFTSFKERHFSAILHSLKRDFDYIVVDVNDGIFFSSTFAALNVADTINVVSLPQMSCVNDTREMVNFLRNNWGIEPGKWVYYLNKANGLSAGMTSAEFDSLMKKETVKIPETKEIAGIANGSSPSVLEAELVLPQGCLEGRARQSKRGIKLLGIGRNMYADKSL